LFSDVPNNVVHAWHPQTGLRVYLKPSGFTGIDTYGREPGSNGLTIDTSGALILAEHGDRRVARLPARSGKLTVADRWEGKRFNSPNDVVVHSTGAIYFTDPFYGLPQGEKDPAREIDFAGVFRVAPDGTVTLATRELERPNGLAFSPDEKILYVANSHGPRPVILAFPLNPDGSLGPSRVFFDAKPLTEKGSLDGLKVDSMGILWATGPGGLLVITPEGKLLGRVLTGRPTANVAFGGTDGKSVFLTASDRILRFPRR
jgi:gluconolactonase